MLYPPHALEVGQSGGRLLSCGVLVRESARSEQACVVEEEQVPFVIDGTKDGVDAIAPTP
jgi:hypothetical protein